VAALTKADGSVLVPARVYGAARKLARTPYGAGLETLAARLMDHRFEEPGGAVGASLAALTWARPGPAARWLTGEALAEVSVRLQSATHRNGVGPGQRPGDYRARAALARHAADIRVLEQAAEIRSQRLHTPFLDNQVVRACRALPEALRVQPGARASILRRVLEGAGVADLPPGWGATSHAPAAVAARTGLRVAAEPLMDLFGSPLLAQAGLVEARVVRKALRSAAEGEPLPLDGLADLVSLELWLGRLLSRRGTCWTGTPARARAVPAGIRPQRGALGAGAAGR
ncbi:asparagine synthase-related protein, partial [Streptomyces nigra]